MPVLILVSCGERDSSATAGRTADAVAEPIPRNLLRNGAFEQGLNDWFYWNDGVELAEYIQAFTGGVRVINPPGRMVGIRQTLTVSSGTVYRLYGSARSTLTNDSTIGFGARLAFFLPPQKEVSIVWMSEYDRWWPKEIVFTNEVNGVATVYAHLGFGGYATTGEFTNIGLEYVRQR